MKPAFLRFLLLIAVLTTLASGTPTLFGQTEKPSQPAVQPGAWRSDPLHIFSESIQALTAKVTKSVVQIVATGYGLSSEKQ